MPGGAAKKFQIRSQGATYRPAAGSGDCHDRKRRARCERPGKATTLKTKGPGAKPGPKQV